MNLKFAYYSCTSIWIDSDFSLSTLFKQKKKCELWIKKNSNNQSPIWFLCYLLSLSNNTHYATVETGLKCFVVLSKSHCLAWIGLRNRIHYNHGNAGIASVWFYCVCSGSRVSIKKVFVLWDLCVVFFLLQHKQWICFRWTQKR